MVTRAVGAHVVAGFRDGNLELLPLEAGRPKPSVAFESIPSSPVTEIRAGPRGTAIVGFANGVLGLWNLADGKPLKRTRLHGSIVHLHQKGTRLYAASELGRTRIWDLGVFDVDYCRLLRRIWTRVPVTWRGGLPVKHPPPAGHRCR